MAWSSEVAAALALPQGARFYRCALQVNPPHYASTFRGEASAGTDDAAAIQALIDAAVKSHIDVIGVTDHNHVGSVEQFATVAAANGIVIFPGFEVRSKEGVHFLCLFPAGTKASVLERYLGELGLHDEEPNDELAKLTCDEIPQFIAGKGGIVIAAHVTQSNGLLKTLSGKPCIQAWRNKHLLAAQIPGAVDGLPVNFRRIIENTDPEFRREDAPAERLALAVVNAQDVVKPEDFAKPSASCCIKMTEPSIEGLRQAFLDPLSRIRLSCDDPLEEHTAFVAIAWEGGFLDGLAIHFSEGLNVLIGGRGTGKSTIVESVRYVLNLLPLGEAAADVHRGVVNEVLRPGTKVALLVRTHRPTPEQYVIERTVPNAAVVRDAAGRLTALTPQDVVGAVEVYGQHEMSELTRSPDKLTRLLDRFVERDKQQDTRRATLRRELERLRTEILSSAEELAEIREQLEELPRLEDKLRRYTAAGIEERLKEKDLLTQEELILKTAGDRIGTTRRHIAAFDKAVPIDRRFLVNARLDELPGKEYLQHVPVLLAELEEGIARAREGASVALNQADTALAKLRAEWANRQKAVEGRYQETLRELQKENVDGAEFIATSKAIAELRPLSDTLAKLEQELQTRKEERRALLVDWEELAALEVRQLEQAAKRVNRRLVDLVRVGVTPAGKREPLFELLRQKVGGTLKPAIDRYRAAETLSLREVADACRGGAAELQRLFGITGAVAERLANAGEEVLMLTEELELPATTQIELNIAPEGQEAVWKPLEHLSTGQKATAILFLLLLEADAPLVIDQPEDDLDNRFITEGIVPKMRAEKRRRQFVFSTHNANIPVLGDAELIVALTTASAGGHGEVRMPLEYMGALDAQPVREIVERILEGGKDAFEARRRKYGF